MNKWLAVTSAAVFALAGAGACPAQSARVASAAADQDASQNTPGESGETPLQEIVVTAQKRAEKLQDVPISISVLSGAALDTTTAMGMSEQLGRVPGLATTTAMQNGGTVVTVRGVAPPYALFNGASTVGYYLDSVPFGLVKSAISPDLDPYDLSRVEVLRGPQGVLYGAASLNGVVRVLTQDADLERFEFKSRVSGSYTESGGGNGRADAAVNVPIVDGMLAARLVVGYESLSGWIDRPNKNNVNDTTFSNVRLKVNAQPTSDLSVGLSYWRSRDRYDDVSQGYTYNLNSETIAEPIDNGFDAYGLKIGYQFPQLTVSSSTSYLTYQSDGVLDLGPQITGNAGDPLFTGLDSKIFTEELNVNSSGAGPWLWSAGGIYRRGKDYQNQALPGVLAEPLYWTDSSTSYAIFGQLTRRFLNGLFDVSAGARYFHDEVRDVTAPGIFDSQPLNATFNHVSPRAVFNWHLSSDLTAYASYSTGFRSGFGQGPLTVLSAPGLPPVQPDKLDNYEVGFKGSLGEAFSFDASAYFLKWRNVQQSVNVFFNGAGVSADVNAPSASGPGIDLSATLRPLTGLTLSGNFSWNHLETDQQVASAGSVYFEKGNRLVYSPEYVAGLAADYTWPLGSSGLIARLSSSGNYTSNFYANTAEATGVRMFEGESVVTTRASFALESPKSWTASVYVENLNNYKGSPLPNNQSTPNPAWHLPDNLLERTRPRTVGIQFDYHWRN